MPGSEKLGRLLQQQRLAVTGQQQLHLVRRGCRETSTASAALAPHAPPCLPTRLTACLACLPADMGVPAEAVAEAYDAFERGEVASPLSAAAVSNQTIQESMRLLLMVRAFQVTGHYAGGCCALGGGGRVGGWVGGQPGCCDGWLAGGRAGARGGRRWLLLLAACRCIPCCCRRHGLLPRDAASACDGSGAPCCACCVRCAAQLDPLGIDERPPVKELDPAYYGFTEKDLDRE